MTVPNQFPTVDPGSVRLACIGECPSIEENTYQRCSRGHGFALQYWEDKRLQIRDRCPVPKCCSRDFTPCPTPFVGWSGRLLDDVLREVGLPREKVFVGNVCQVMPPGGKLDSLHEALLWESGDMAASLEQLRADLRAFRPNVVLCLGNEALRVFHTDMKATVTNWRGSIFASTFLSGGTHSDNPPGKGLMGAVTACPPVCTCEPTHPDGHFDYCPRYTPSPPSNNLTDATGSIPTALPTGTTPPAGVASPLSPLTSDLPESAKAVSGCSAPDASEKMRVNSGLSTDFVDKVYSTYVPVPLKRSQCEKESLNGAYEEGDGGWWCLACMDKWEVANGQHWEDGSPLTLKCTTSYHPAAVLRTPGWTALMRFDVARAVAEAATPVLTLPERVFEWRLTADEIVVRLAAIRVARQRVGTDIEGVATSGVTDLSFAMSPSHVVWVPFKTIDGSPWWPPITEQRLWTAVREVMEDADVPKVCHAGGYEGFVLQWAHGITLRGLVDDTMLMWHECYAELDKGLETPVSLLTKTPYWGTSKDATTDEERAIYNCTDSAVTLEIADVMAPMLDAGQRDHYTTNVSLLAPCLWQMLKGIRYDTVARDRLVAELQHDVYELQGELDALAGIAPPTFAEVAAVVALKRKLATVVDWPDIVAAAKPLWAKGGRAKRVVEMARRAQPVAVPVPCEEAPV